MSDNYSVKKITELTAKTSADDSDIYVLGNAGSATMRRITFANLASAIKEKLKTLTVSTLNTSNKTLPGAINELNSRIVTGTIEGGRTMSFTYSQSAILYIFRQQNSSRVVYALDFWNYKAVMGGTENADITVTVASSHAVTVSNAKANAVQYIAIIM